jgi:predicted DNA-binding antitoxin AbrB/MazE fold protein
MAKEFRARFSHGVLKPLEAVDLKEGEEVRVIIADQLKGKGMIEALRASAGGWKGLIDAEELKRNIYADRLSLFCHFSWVMPITSGRAMSSCAIHSLSSQTAKAEETL